MDSSSFNCVLGASSDAQVSNGDLHSADYILHTVQTMSSGYYASWADDSAAAYVTAVISQANLIRELARHSTRATDDRFGLVCERFCKELYKNHVHMQFLAKSIFIKSRIPL